LELKGVVSCAINKIDAATILYALAGLLQRALTLFHLIAHETAP